MQTICERASLQKTLGGTVQADRGMEIKVRGGNESRDPSDLPNTGKYPNAPQGHQFRSQASSSSGAV